jgi:DNA-binding SARP family transcriptional activator
VTTLLEELSTYEAKRVYHRREVRRAAKVIPFSEPKIRIQGFGDATVYVNGGEVDWSWAKARELLFCLLVHRSGLRKEQLAEMLWPEHGAKRQRERFKEAIYHLRRAVDAGIVRYDGTRYLFNDQVDYVYDVEDFQQNRALGTSVTTKTEQVAALEAAVASYSGPFAPSFDAEWVVIERTTLQKHYIESLLALARHHLANDDYERALSFCHQALQTDPAMEVAHRLLMRIYATSGNRVEAVRQFERCRERLAEDLSLTPSARTVQLYRTLVG